MEKLLPIKFFEKRKIDEQLTEAGGSKDLPKWVMQGDDLTQRSQHLAGSMTQVAASFEAHKMAAHELPMVMATTITEKALAKTHRSTVVDLLNSDSQLNVIGIESIFPVVPPTEETEGAPAKKDEEPKETRRILSIVTTDELITNINWALQDTQNNARLISSIEDMEPFEARSGAYNPDNRVYRVRLIDYQDRHRNQLAQTLFRNQCASNGITIDRETRYSPDMRLIWFGEYTRTLLTATATVKLPTGSLPMKCRPECRVLPGRRPPFSTLSEMRNTAVTACFRRHSLQILSHISKSETTENCRNIW